MFNGVCRTKLFIMLIIISTVHGSGHKKLSTVKYILQWTTGNEPPVVLMPTGQHAFTGCLWDNCYITRSKLYFNDLTDFDAVIFRASDFNRIESTPPTRHPRQKYVFVSQEPASIYPLPPQPVNFFNMTWTYKLDSDITFREIIVKNRYGEEIGPQRVMKWIKLEDMLPSDDYLVSKLKNKSKAVAWIESSCLSLSGRELYVAHLLYELAKLGLSVDIFGECGNDRIRNMKLEDILRSIESDYYFYLAFEKTLDEDYVTEQLLYALQHFTVPIVFGGANYSRFMPDGIYLNAREMSPERLAKQINEMIEDKELYYEFFRWRGYYNYYKPDDLKGESEYCKFCEVLNDDKKMEQSVTYLNLADWWNRPPKYRPLVHRRNFTEALSSSRRYLKKIPRSNKHNQILIVTDADDPDAQLLDVETTTSVPRAYIQMSETRPNKKFKIENSPKHPKNKLKSKSTKTQRNKINKTSIIDNKHHGHKHDKQEHDDHKPEEHPELRTLNDDRILEWHDDLIDYTQYKDAHRMRPNIDVQGEVKHLNFFFDVQTIVTEDYTKTTHYYAPKKGFFVSVDSN